MSDRSRSGGVDAIVANRPIGPMQDARRGANITRLYITDRKDQLVIHSKRHGIAEDYDQRSIVAVCQQF